MMHLNCVEGDLGPSPPYLSLIRLLFFCFLLFVLIVLNL